MLSEEFSGVQLDMDISFLNFKEPFIHLLVDDFVSSFDGYYKELDGQKNSLLKSFLRKNHHFSKH